MSAVDVSPLAFEIAWDPGIRGILVVAVGAAILMGSIYLLLATNTGSRLGFLIAAAGFWGWMSIMGLQWWVYGIGFEGSLPSWRVVEIIRSDTPDDLSAARLEEAHDLSDWNQLAADDPERGEAQAAADEALTGEDSRVAVFETTGDYQSIDAYDIGGKEGIQRRLPGPHPARYALVQVQQVVPVVTLQEGETCPDDATCIDFGETPPRAEPDPDEPIVSVAMVRDLGTERLPPALITITSVLLFGVTCYVLHTRDRRVAANRALTA